MSCEEYKASKTAAQSAAFQNKKTALFSESRKRVAAAVSDGFATMYETHSVRYHYGSDGL